MTAESVFGVVSLIFWSVTIVVTLGYVLLVMRASNDGEGGIMALITLAGSPAHAWRPADGIAACGVSGHRPGHGDPEGALAGVRPGVPVRPLRDGLLLAGRGRACHHGGRGVVRRPGSLLVPHWGRLPMVLLATVATVIATQTVISGAFSVAHQAVQLG